MADRTYVIVITSNFFGYQARAEGEGLNASVTADDADATAAEMRVRERVRERWGPNARCVEVRRPR